MTNESNVILECKPTWPRGLLGSTGIHLYDEITLFQDCKETQVTINNRVNIVKIIAVHKALIRATMKDEMQRHTFTAFSTKSRNTVIDLHLLLID